MCCCRHVQKGKTALYWAAKKGRTELGLALLAVEGVDVNATDEVSSVCLCLDACIVAWLLPLLLV